jgi:hypothetical protein
MFRNAILGPLKSYYSGEKRSDPKPDPKLFESWIRIRNSLKSRIRNSLKSRIRIRNEKFQIHNIAGSSSATFRLHSITRTSTTTYGGKVPVNSAYLCGTNTNLQTVKNAIWSLPTQVSPPVIASSKFLCSSLRTLSLSLQFSVPVNMFW